jgi:hypothetical protein
MFVSELPKKLPLTVVKSLSYRGCSYSMGRASPTSRGRDESCHEIFPGHERSFDFIYCYWNQIKLIQLRNVILDVLQSPW